MAAVTMFSVPVAIVVPRAVPVPICLALDPLALTPPWKLIASGSNAARYVNKVCRPVFRGQAHDC